MADYDELMASWMALTHVFSSWTLSEIKDLTPRERLNWLEIAREYGKAVKKASG